MTKLIIKIVWWIRFIFKFLILSLHLPNHIFHKIGIFRHGAMDKDKYVDEIWELHFSLTSDLYKVSTNGDFLELGPGDTIKSSLKAKNVGFKNVFLIDNGNHAIDSDLTIKEFNDKENIDNTKYGNDSFDCKYLIDGTKSLKGIKDSSVSFAFSNSVLQHIGLEEIEDVINDLHRVSAINSIQSHVIDLRDMINRSSLHLKCPSYIWENKSFKKFPIYTNRLLTKDWAKLFSKSGFKILELKTRNDLNIDIEARPPFFDLYNKIANIHIIVKKT
jgi:hypothetical protein